MAKGLYLFERAEKTGKFNRIVLFTIIINRYKIKQLFRKPHPGSPDPTLPPEGDSQRLWRSGPVYDY
jgi:hypothetical protein